jgi:tetratricopeptide (TPR) repeat protein
MVRRIVWHGTLMALVLLTSGPARGDWQVAVEAFKAGSFEDARNLLEEVVASHPDYAPAHHLLGVCLGKGGQWDAAVASLERASELDSENAQVSLSLAQAQLKLGYASGAVTTLGAMPEVPDQVKATYGQLLAAAASRLDDPATAIGRLEKATLLVPESKDLWTAMGRARESGGDLPGAFDAYSMATSLDPEDAALVRTAVEVAYEEVRKETSEEGKGRWYGKAAELAQRLVEVSEDPEALLLAGETLLFLGQHEAAWEWLVQATGKKPDSALAHFYLASSLSGRGEDGATLAELEEALALASSEDLTQRIYRLQGFTFRRIKDFDSAISAYEKAGDEAAIAEAEAARKGALANAELEQKMAECREKKARIEALLQESQEVLGPSEVEALRRDAEKKLAGCAARLD